MLQGGSWVNLDCAPRPRYGSRLNYAYAYGGETRSVARAAAPPLLSRSMERAWLIIASACACDSRARHSSGLRLSITCGVRGVGGMGGDDGRWGR